MSKNEGPVFSQLGFLVVLMFCATLMLFTRAWVFSKLWYWFVHPLLAVPNIPMAYAIGLLTIVGMVSKQKDFDDVNEDNWLPSTMTNLLKSAVCLGMGWIAHFYT